MNLTDRTMLYRPGDEPNPEAWNLPIETLIVASSEIDGALGEGWYRGPEDFPDDGEPAPLTLLDKPVKDIVGVLPDLTADELSALLADEQAGKTRTTLIAAIEAAQAVLASKDT